MGLYLSLCLAFVSLFYVLDDMVIIRFKGCYVCLIISGLEVKFCFCIQVLVYYLACYYGFEQGAVWI